MIYALVLFQMACIVALLLCVVDIYTKLQDHARANRYMDADMTRLEDRVAAMQSPRSRRDGARLGGRHD